MVEKEKSLAAVTEHADSRLLLTITSIWKANLCYGRSNSPLGSGYWLKFPISYEPGMLCELGWNFETVVYASAIVLQRDAHKRD